MSTTSMVAAAGAFAVVTAAAWWVIRGIARWWTTVRWRRIQVYHATLRAELQVSHERFYTRCADRPAWTEQKLADLETAFAEIDAVLDKRRRDELAVLRRTAPAPAPPVAPVVLGISGAVAMVAAVMIGL